MPKFVDRVVVHATAGAGGNGCASVHREKFKPLGGPDGGNGGRGGSVVLVVDPGVHTLLDFHHRPHATAHNGKQGQGGFKAGANADDLLLAVAVLALAAAFWQVRQQQQRAAIITGVVAIGLGALYFAIDEVPGDFSTMTPYVVTLLVLAFASQRLRMPAADGQIYRKGSAG